jgi:hypothetical protein
VQALRREPAGSLAWKTAAMRVPLRTDQAYTDRGGYEQTFSFVAPCEGPLKAGSATVLGVAVPRQSPVAKAERPFPARREGRSDRNDRTSYAGGSSRRP